MAIVAVNCISSTLNSLSAHPTTSIVCDLEQQRPFGVFPPSWQRPSRGRFKCNIGATFLNEWNITDLGMCIRNEEGVFVLAKVIPLLVMHNIVVGKVVGLYHALEWLSDMRIDNADFAVDSKSTVDAFNNPRPDISEFGLIIYACRSLFNLKFTNSKVEFNQRQANEVTHALAGAATLLASPIIYSYVPR